MTEGLQGEWAGQELSAAVDRAVDRAVDQFCERETALQWGEMAKEWTQPLGTLTNTERPKLMCD